MVSLVYGFIGYARHLLNDSGDKEYVPALHCNQSSIDGLFSHVRANDKDKTDLYGLGIMQQNISGFMKCTRVKIKSNMYPDGDATTDRLIKNENDKDFCFN